MAGLNQSDVVDAAAEKVVGPSRSSFVLWVCNVHRLVFGIDNIIIAKEPTGLVIPRQQRNDAGRPHETFSRRAQHPWLIEMSLPDAWFETRSSLRRHEHGSQRWENHLSRPVVVSQGLKSAVELVELVNKHFKHPEMDGVRVKDDSQR